MNITSEKIKLMLRSRWGRTRRSKERGFTLVEVLLTSCIASLVALSLYVVLNSGITVWQRVNRPLFAEDVLIFFEVFDTELKNTFVHPFGEFQGDQTSCSFTTMIADPRRYGDAFKRIGLVSYHFDEPSGALERLQRTASDLFQEKPGVSRPVLDNLKDLNFSYFFFDEKEERYFWGGEWPVESGPQDQAVFPLAVKVTLGDGGDTYAKVVFLPMGR